MRTEQFHTEYPHSGHVSSDARHQRSADAGLTLVEILVSMLITGMIVSTMTFAFTAFIRSYPETVDRVAISKDVTFVQAWLPIDLASATVMDADPTLQPALAQTTPLMGTNVLMITRKDLQTPGHPEFLVNYRFAEISGEWVLIRFEIRNVGSTDPANPEDVRQVGVAHELVQPPDTWDEDTAPTFAIDVTGRNPGRLRKVGSDVTVHFVDGTSYETGGAGLGPGSSLTEVSGDGFVNPTSPPSRCGGAITLVMDTSSSLHDQLPIVKQAAKDFVDAFRGTPTLLRIVEFDTYGKAIAPQDESAPGIFGNGSPAGWDDPAIDMLNLTTAEADHVKDLIDELTTDSSGTNWEAGLRIGMTDNDDLVGITPSPFLPDTLVFFTDGEPYKAIRNSGSEAGKPHSADPDDAVAEAKTISNNKGEWGVTLKGVFVNNGGQSGSRLEEAKDRMKQVVGPTEWVPGPNDSSGKPTVGNADSAEFFYTTDFAQLSNIFQQIFVSDCGGTITVQRRENNDINDKVSTGSYEYTTTSGVGTLKAAEANSITFDYELDSGATAWIPIHESSSSGADIVDVQCFHNGTDVTAARVRPLFDQNPDTSAYDVPVPSGREVEVRANEALSCIFIGA